MCSFLRISTICSVLVLNFSFSATAWAQLQDRTTDQAKAAVLIPWSFVERWVNAQSVSNSNSTGPQTLIDENLEKIDFVVADIPVHIPSAHILVNGSFAPVEALGKLTRWQTKNLSVDLQLAGFQVEKEFVKDIDGATIIVTLKAQCGNFAIRQNQAQFMTGLAWQAVDQGFDLTAEELQISWPANSWQVESLVCEGPEGFGALVQEQISQALKDPTQIENWLKPLMQSRLNQYISTALEPLKKPSFIENNKIVTVKIGETAVADNEGLVIGVDIVTQEAYQGPTAAQNIDVNVPANIWQQVKGQPLLILPKKFVENIGRQAKIIPRLENRLNDIPAFQSVLSSRLKQFFGWPELRKFKKTAPFLATSMVQGQDYALPNNPPVLKFTGNKSISVTASVSTWVRAERDGQMINWAYFDTKIKGHMSYVLSNGEMVFSLVNPQIQMKATHAAEYMAKYPNKHKFPIDRLEAGMLSQLNIRKYRFAMPALNLKSIGLNEQLKTESVTEQGENLIFSFTNVQK